MTTDTSTRSAERVTVPPPDGGYAKSMSCAVSVDDTGFRIVETAGRPPGTRLTHEIRGVCDLGSPPGMITDPGRIETPRPNDKQCSYPRGRDSFLFASSRSRS